MTNDHEDAGEIVALAANQRAATAPITDDTIVFSYLFAELAPWLSEIHNLVDLDKVMADAEAGNLGEDSPMFNALAWGIKYVIDSWLEGAATTVTDEGGIV